MAHPSPGRPRRRPQLAQDRYRMEALPGLPGAEASSWSPQPLELADPARQGHLPLDGSFLGPLFNDTTPPETR
jgi:hypothetical protein